MTRDAFMKELAYLLQDISEEDRQDALQYYRDYFDDAGPEREETVLRELGSPERVAAIIRANLAGQDADGGEFTDSGYEDSSYEDSGYEDTGYEDTGYEDTGYSDGYYEEDSYEEDYSEDPYGYYDEYGNYIEY